MRKTLSLLLAALLTLALLSACGGEDSKSGAGHSFSYTLVGNPDTLDPQLATNNSAKTVLANLFEGLFVLDADGNVQNGVVESYTVSDDGLHYYFTLREDSYWYQAVGEDSAFSKDAAVAVTAMDFVYAFQRLFDPLYQSPYREAFSCILNAGEIIEAEQDPSMIGVYARKANELEIVLAYPNAGLPLLLTLPAALPCNQSYFESTKGRYGLDEKSIIGNGSFAMQRWLYDPYGKYNVIQLCRNPLNHENYRVYPIDLTLYIEESDADAAKIFSGGTTDCYVTTQDDLLSNPEYRAESAYSMTLGLIVNPDSRYADPDIRRALAIGLDRAQLVLDGTDVQTAAGVLPPAVTLLNKSCRDLIADTAYLRYDLADAKRAFSKGLENLNTVELEACRILVPTGAMDYTVLTDVIQCWQRVLDVHLSIEEVAESSYRSRIAAGDYTLALYAVTGNDYTASSVFQNVLADQNIPCAHKEEVRELLEQAAAVSNLTECVELYRQAETVILEDDCFIPLFYKQRYLICKSSVEDVIFNPFSGQVRFSEAKYFD